jgi:AcrR family transcriptional regulator
MSSVYHYFGSMEGILLAVMERGADRFFTDLPPWNRRAGRPAEHLAAVLAGPCAPSGPTPISSRCSSSWRRSRPPSTTERCRRSSTAPRPGTATAPGPDRAGLR